MGEKDDETVPVKIASSLEKLISKADINSDSIISPANLQDRKEKTTSLNLASYSLSIPDEEEIECLKEDSIQKDSNSQNILKMSYATSQLKKHESLMIKEEVNKETEMVKHEVTGPPLKDTKEIFMRDTIQAIDQSPKIEIEQDKKIISVTVE